MEDGATEAGSVNEVQRVGDTVHRPAGEWTDAVQSLLGFLEERGVAGVPRALGLDERGREVVSYLDGTVARRPWPATMLSGSGVLDAARWLQQYLVAARDYPGPPEGFRFRDPASVCQPGEVVNHGDLGPWNMVFTAGGGDPTQQKFVGVIDWDLAQPGPPEMSIGQLLANGNAAIRTTRCIIPYMGTPTSYDAPGGSRE